MNLTPTIKAVVLDEDVPSVVWGLRGLMPDKTDLEICDWLISFTLTADIPSPILSPRAVFIESGIEVSDFKGELSHDFINNGDRYLVLVSGDVINMTADTRETAAKLFLEMTKNP